MAAESSQRGAFFDSFFMTFRSIEFGSGARVVPFVFVWWVQMACGPSVIRGYLKIQLEALRGGRAVSLDTLSGLARVCESLYSLNANQAGERLYSLNANLPGGRCMAELVYGRAYIL
jgi:hypothetical protein